MKNVQMSLGYFGFTKKVVNRGKEQEFKIPNFIDAEEELITHWVDNTYNKLISQDYKPYVWRMWEKNRMSHYR